MNTFLSSIPGLEWMRGVWLFYTGVLDGLAASGVEEISGLLGLIRDLGCYALYKVVRMSLLQQGHDNVEAMFAALGELFGRVLDDPAGELAKAISALKAEFAAAECKG